MKVRSVTANVQQLTRARFVNAFLVREPDGFTLVDTGLGGAGGTVLAIARRSGGEIRRILLTHGHQDHAGSLDGLRERLGAEVEVSMSDLDARICAGERVIEGKRRGSWASLETAPDVRLVGGERIGSLEVIATPGHTPGHLAFLDTRDRSLFAGDTFTTYVRTEIPNRPLQPFPLAAMGTQDDAEVVESARLLRALDPSVLLVGHGPAVRAPGEAMGAAIRRGGGR
jgi:glyoxylase-like metal-dependent hydrolase (beta-lactamase superfamily II)